MENNNEQITQYNIEDILSVAMDIGEFMLKCGAEVWRVEDTISRISTAYGCSQSDVFSITSMIITTNFKGNHSATQSRRVHSYSYNMKQLEDLNELSREICKNLPNPSEVKKMIRGIVARDTLSRWRKIIGFMLGSAAFTFFFGGTLLDSLFAAIVAVAVFFTDSMFNKSRVNMLAYTVVTSSVAGFVAIALVKTGIGLHLDKIIIGNVMLLIPGIGLTNGIRDLLCGDIVTGLLRLCEAILVAISVAVGFAIPLLIIGGV